VYAAMAALVKLQRVGRSGYVLLRNGTLLIRPHVQKPVTLKQQLRGNRCMFDSVVCKLTFIPRPFAFSTLIQDKTNITQIISAINMQLFCCD
jgi:hypothetical protein